MYNVFPAMQKYCIDGMNVVVYIISVVLKSFVHLFMYLSLIHVYPALNEALTGEVQRLKLATGEITDGRMSKMGLQQQMNSQLIQMQQLQIQQQQQQQQPSQMQQAQQQQQQQQQSQQSA
jgi:hypothetical protein